MHLKVATYNILHSYFAVQHNVPEGYGITEQGKRIENTAQRMPLIQKNMAALDADIICLQEVDGHYLTAHPNLCIHYAAHSHLEANVSYGNGFWLNPKSPWQITHSGHIAGPGQYPRVAVYVDIEHAKTGVKVRVLNVHLKGYNLAITDAAQWRKNSAQGREELEYYVAQCFKMPLVDMFIVAGDFNEDESRLRVQQSRLQYLKNLGFATTQNMATTYPATQQKIDWLWRKNQNNAFKFSANEYIPKVPHPTASDHLPVVVEVEFK